MRTEYFVIKRSECDCVSGPVVGLKYDKENDIEYQCEDCNWTGVIEEEVSLLKAMKAIGYQEPL